MAELDELFGNEKQTTMEPYSKDDWIKKRNENRAFDLWFHLNIQQHLYLYHLNSGYHKYT